MTHRDMSLADAIALAARHHADQLDLSGEPYILHVLRVMLGMPPGPARLVAVLHDVVEDTACSFDELRALGCPAEVLAALDCLTLRKHDAESYQSYFARIREDPLAVRVKLADIEDNLKLSRMLVGTDEDLLRIRVYVEAHRALRQSLDAEAVATPVTQGGALASPSVADLFYQPPDPADRAGWTQQRPGWANLRFLLLARLAPLARQRLAPLGWRWSDELASQLHPWSARLLEVASALAETSVSTLSALSAIDPPVIPIKGVDALLWEGGRVGQVHTSDIDLLIHPDTRAAVEAVLAERGFAQVEQVDCETGEVRLCSPEHIAEREQGYEYWPWLRYHWIPSLDAGVDLARNGAERWRSGELDLRRVHWPLSVIRGHVHLGIEIDLHHGVWPKIPYDRLRAGLRSHGTYLFARMLPADQLVTAGSKMAGELVEGKLGGLGTMAQLVSLLSQYGSPELALECRERAESLELVDEWDGCVAVLHAALGPRAASDPRLPQPSQLSIVERAGEVLGKAAPGVGFPHLR